MIDPKKAYDVLMDIQGAKWFFKGILWIYYACYRYVRRRWHNELIIKIDLPGYAKKDIRLSIAEDILRIRANKERDEEWKNRWSGSLCWRCHYSKDSNCTA